MQQRMLLWVTENWPSFHLFVGSVRLQCPVLGEGIEGGGSDGPDVSMKQSRR